MGVSWYVRTVGWRDSGYCSIKLHGLGPIWILLVERKRQGTTGEVFSVTVFSKQKTVDVNAPSGSKHPCHPIFLLQEQSTAVYTLSKVSLSDMVLLTMTAASVAAVQECVRLGFKNATEAKSSAEPQLDDPEVGKPISHGQLIDISRHLKKHYQDAIHEEPQVPYHLDQLLRGSHVYISPPPPKKEPVSDLPPFLMPY